MMTPAQCLNVGHVQSMLKGVNGFQHWKFVRWVVNGFIELELAGSSVCRVFQVVDDYQRLRETGFEIAPGVPYRLKK